MNGRRMLCRHIDQFKFEIKTDASVIEINDVEAIGFIDQKPVVTEADLHPTSNK